MQTYFHDRRDAGDPLYTGAAFDRLAGGGDAPKVANRFTADDLSAVTMLSVSVDPRAALRMLETEADDLSALLAKIPAELDLIDADNHQIGPDSPADELWRRVDRYHPVGETTTSKLLARKRPRLLPVIDSVVREVLAITWSGDYWRQMRDYLREESPRWEFLRAAHAAAGLADGISLLRCFDVLLWMSRQPGCPPPSWGTRHSPA
ncbi:DUF6308 family protein [Actinomycetospora rhizophila]|uniref:DUF6308 family protein n=1 Tax=Actinomycetospora rhizophila TaxID=1416876 RepID=UPI00366C6EA7